MSSRDITCEYRCCNGWSETLSDRLVDRLKTLPVWSICRVAGFVEVWQSSVWRGLICGADPPHLHLLGVLADGLGWTIYGILDRRVSFLASLSHRAALNPGAPTCPWILRFSWMWTSHLLVDKLMVDSDLDLLDKVITHVYRVQDMRSRSYSMVQYATSPIYTKTTKSAPRHLTSSLQSRAPSSPPRNATLAIVAAKVRPASSNDSSPPKRMADLGAISSMSKDRRHGEK